MDKEFCINYILDDCLDTCPEQEKDGKCQKENKQLKNCKYYVKMLRAVAYEVGDQHFKLGKQEYPWYEEELFHKINMEEIVKKDNPFGGWYKYEIEEKYAQVITIKAEDYPALNSSELQTGDLVKDEYGHTGIFISNSDFREDTGYFLVKQGKFFNTLESMKHNWSKIKHFSEFSKTINSLNN